MTDYPARLIDALRRAAPSTVQDPTVVVLTPGVHNSAFYEHALLARLMGVHLVEGRDLICHGTDVFLRTTEGEVPVHVIYRRIDDDYLDPLQFRPESLVGCPGVMNAARAGRVTIANGVGNGVADDKMVYTYVPAMIRYYLGEDPVLDNVETMHLVDDAVRKDTLGRRDQLVFKRVDSSGGKGLVIGPAASGAELDELVLDVEADPGPGSRARRRALDVPHLGGPVDGAAPRGPASLRGQRRREHLGSARGTDPGRPARGRPRRELEPGRGVQGHLGRGRRPLHARAPAAPDCAPQRRATDGLRTAAGLRARRATATAATGQQQQQKQQQQPHQQGQSQSQSAPRVPVGRP